jgi:hypothetical protein
MEAHEDLGCDNFSIVIFLLFSSLLKLHVMKKTLKYLLSLVLAAALNQQQDRQRYMS